MEAEGYSVEPTLDLTPPAVDSDSLSLDTAKATRWLSSGGRERAFGVVYTPRHLVDFMVHLAYPHRKACRVLEPACADAPFLASFAQHYGRGHELVGVEIDPEHLKHARWNVPQATFVEADFLLWDPRAQFDIVLGNPPYGIIGDASHYPIHVLKERKKLYRQRSRTWYGKFNIYAAFIEHAVELLAPDGRLVFVVPASWLVLDDFQRLRSFLAESGKLHVYYLGKVFPKRNVSVVVLVVEKGGQGLLLYDGTEELKVFKPEYSGEMIRFETAEWLRFERRGIPLEELFEIHFAARSPEVRKHPAVVSESRPGYVPVLTGRNLHAGRIDYESGYSGLWMPRERAAELRSFYGFPHLVVAHTKGARVVCAYDERCYPWREEFHLVPKVGSPDPVAIMEYLNSDLVQHYVKQLYRDFVPHLTATMLKRVPVDRAVARFATDNMQLLLLDEEAIHVNS
ncbi:MAG: modification methylase TthHB8I [Armatimonadota bacterium]|nr:MAG: modification methylase TthHB8I [Armatimonadota bacterium]